jgi:hypothetical protein
MPKKANKDFFKNLPELKGNTLLAAIIAAAVLVVGVVYYLTADPTSSYKETIHIYGKPVELVRFTNLVEDNSNGRAVRYLMNGKFFYEVVAELPALEDGTSYTAWLMNGPNMFVKTGELELLSEPIYTLSHVADTDYTDYLRAIVTAQPKDAEKPGAPILEAYFEEYYE